VFVCVFVCLQVSVSRIAMRYIVISVTAGALVVMATIDAEPRTPANGLTTSVLLIYTTTLLHYHPIYIIIISGTFVAFFVSNSAL